jgi:hypothetical protein
LHFENELNKPKLNSTFIEFQFQGNYFILEKRGRPFGSFRPRQESSDEGDEEGGEDDEQGNITEYLYLTWLPCLL